MKKLSILIVAFIMIALSCFVPVSAEEQPASLSATEIDALTKELCSTYKDRTSFTEACLTAATGIKEMLSSEYDASVETFKRDVTVQNGFSYSNKTLESYNVVAFMRNPDKNKKTILITTNFANHYAKSDFGNGIEAEGALGTAATTALTVKLANYLVSNVSAYQYNFAFAFFSGTDEGNFGSEEFRKTHIGNNIMFVINFERLGCDNTYFYTDEVETPHGNFIKEVISNDKFDMEEFPSEGRVLLDYQTVDDLPYSHYAIMGDISTFMSAGKSCLELLGGKVSGLKLTEDGKTSVTNTSDDTYDNLVARFPNYSQKLVEVGQLIARLSSDKKLGEVCQGSASSYKIFTKGWVAYVICLGVIGIMIVAMILVLHFLEKRYPVPVPPLVKIAVFGKEFEEFKENEIVVDIRHEKKDDDDPFDNK